MKMTRMRTTATTSDAAQTKQTAKMTKRRTRRERERPQRPWCCTARRWWRTSSAWASPLTGRICYALLGHVDGTFDGL